MKTIGFLLTIKNKWRIADLLVKYTSKKTWGSLAVGNKINLELTPDKFEQIKSECVSQNIADISEEVIYDDEPYDEIFYQIRNPEERMKYRKRYDECKKWYDNWYNHLSQENKDRIEFLSRCPSGAHG